MRGRFVGVAGNNMRFRSRGALRASNDRFVLGFRPPSGESARMSAGRECPPFGNVDVPHGRVAAAAAANSDL